MTTEKVNLKHMSLERLTEWVCSAGEKPFRAKQIFQWIHRLGVSDVEQMTNLSKRFRETLKTCATSPELTLKNVMTSVDGTRKLLFTTADGRLLESVIIPMPSGYTQCVSSQIGCHIGCPYCLTGKIPDRRNLQICEILDQVYVARRILAEEETEIRNLVFMGMGEPLHNFDNLVGSLNLLMDERGANFSSRRITVSTSGLVKRIKRLGQEVGVNLAISLNAVTDDVRDMMVPINKAHPLKDLMACLREYPLPPRRRITIEYVMCAGVNDSLHDAHTMVKLLKGLRVKINLIPFNPYPNAEFSEPSHSTVVAFQRVLYDAGYQVNIRLHKGRDIGAACGQLDALDTTKQLPMATN